MRLFEKVHFQMKEKPLIAREVQEIIFICFLGLLCYFVLICRILFRKPPTLAQGLSYDIGPANFLQRKPDDIDSAYFNGTPSTIQ